MTLQLLGPFAAERSLPRDDSALSLRRCGLMSRRGSWKPSGTVSECSVQKATLTSCSLRVNA